MFVVRIPIASAVLVLELLLLLTLLGSGCARGDTASNSGEFSMLTYNVNGLPPITGAQPDPQKRNRLTGALLNNYPLALIQEDFSIMMSCQPTLNTLIKPHPVILLA